MAAERNWFRPDRANVTDTRRTKASNMAALESERIICDPQRVSSRFSAAAR